MSYLTDNRYFFFTLLLSGLLVIPWGLSVLSPDLEPYPAVIMPSGEGTVSLDKSSLEFTRQSLWAQNSKGDWEKLEVAEFLNPIPRQYFYAISRNDFGTRVKHEEVFPFRLLPDLTVKRSKVTQAEAGAVKIWLANRLGSLGYDPGGFETRTETMRVNRTSGRVLGQEVTDVKAYTLR